MKNLHCFHFKRFSAVVCAFIVILLYSPSSVSAQMAVGDTMRAAHPSAELEVFSDSKGFLPPRMTTAQRDSIVAPADGLLIFDTDLNRLMYFYDGAWRDVGFWSESDSTAGDIIYGGGNVGIGTTDPQEKLHVAGNIYSSDTIKADKVKLTTGACSGCVLKSDGSGIASWVDPDSLSAITHCLWVGAGAMIPQSTNGAKASTEQTTTNLIMTDYFIFDTTDYVQFSFSTKKKVVSTVNIQVYWDIKTGASAGDSIKWAIAARAVGDDDVINGSWGTEATVTDAVTAVGDLHVTSSTSVTVGNSPALGDMIWFRLRRKAGGTYVPEHAKLAAVSITY